MMNDKERIDSEEQCTDHHHGHSESHHKSHYAYHRSDDTHSHGHKNRHHRYGKSRRSNDDQRSKSKSSQKKKIIIVSVILLLIVAVLVFMAWFQGRGTITSVEEKPIEIIYNGHRYVYNENVNALLLIGIDKFDDRAKVKDAYVNYQQSDLLVLLAMDKEKKTVKAFQINRDTMADIRRIGATGDDMGTEKAQIALAHTYGSGGQDSCLNVVASVEKLFFGTPIDHYVSTTMDAIGEINDLAGGVTVEVLHDFNGLNGIGNAGSVITLSGDQALTYVRARGDIQANTNLERMERHHQYMDALYIQLKKKASEDKDFVSTLVTKEYGHMLSDYSANRLSDIGEQILEYEYLGMTKLPGEAKQGEVYVEYYTDDAALKEMIVNTFYVLDDKNN